MEAGSFPGRSLPLAGAPAVGRPVALPLLRSYFALGLAGWTAAAGTAVAAAPDLAAGRPTAPLAVLAAHLVALGMLPLAVSGASFHLLPVMLRNDLPSARVLRTALPLLAGGYLLAPGLAFDLEPLVWVGAGLVAAGLTAVLSQVLALVVRAPRGRLLVTSRLGVSLSAFHAAAALVLGAFVFSGEGHPVAGVSHDRWILVHLHVALLGWLALLIMAVGRTLAPMLSGAPAAPPRSRPVEEVVLTAGLWLLVTGIALDALALVIAGAAVVAGVLGRFGALLARTSIRRRAPLEAPLAHLIAGGAFLVQATGLGLAAAAGADTRRLVTAYVVLLLVGWAGGVVLGHLGKLLSLSVWVWWPPGPRPKQAALYPRRLWLGEAAVFAPAVQCLVLGAAVGSRTAATAGAAALAASAALALAAVCATLLFARRPAP